MSPNLAKMTCFGLTHLFKWVRRVKGPFRRGSLWENLTFLALSGGLGRDLPPGQTRGKRPRGVFGPLSNWRITF